MAASPTIAPALAAVAPKLCSPCAERGRGAVAAAHLVGDTWFCGPCYRGEDNPWHPANKGRRAPLVVRQLRLKGLTQAAIEDVCIRDAERLVTEYLPAAHARFCCLCGAERPAGRVFCAACTRRNDEIKRVKSWLRQWVKNGDKALLYNAASAIRRWGLRPDDLMSQ
jgi:hypothetical protein